MKNKECVIFPTDKSNNFSIDSVDNYIHAATAHIEKDTVLTKNQFKRLETLFNSHATFWINILRISERSGDKTRFKQSMIVTTAHQPKNTCSEKMTKR